MRNGNEVEVVLDAVIVQTLREARGWHDTLHGRVEVSWALDPIFSVTVVVPCGVRGSVVVPKELMVVGAVMDGTTMVRDGEFWVARELRCGTYRF